MPSSKRDLDFLDLVEGLGLDKELLAVVSSGLGKMPTKMLQQMVESLAVNLERALAAPGPAVEDNVLIETLSAKSILLFEDPPVVTSSLRELLSAHHTGTEIHTATDTTDAERLVDQHNKADLLLLDMNFRNAAGGSLLQDIVRQIPSLKVIAISSFSEPGEGLRALELGASGFIPKSASPRDIVSAISFVLSGGIYVPSDLIENLSEGSRVGYAQERSDDATKVTSRRGLGVADANGAGKRPVARSVVARSVVVRPFEEDDRPRWSAFVERCPDATFFHRIEWKSIIESCFKHKTHYLLAERSSEIVGVLPLAETKSRLFGHALVSLPFAIYGGIAAIDTEAETLLRDATTEYGKALGVDHLEVRSRGAPQPSWQHNASYATFRRQIAADAIAMLLAVPRKQRARIRKGIAFGLTAEVDESPERFFDLYLKNVSRHRIPALPKEYFAALKQEFGDACETLIVLTSSKEPVSGVMTFYFRDEVLPYYAGDTAAAREYAANDFKYWELMRRSSERGYRVFDFGRSKVGSGSFEFKKNWGFEPTLLSYDYRTFGEHRVLPAQSSMPAIPALTDLWQRLPVGVAGALRSYVVKHGVHEGL